jgi:FixJ family two-component response regulator
LVFPRVGTIAILEDDADLRGMLAELYESVPGQHCVTAGSVDELVRRGAEVLQSELSILDINLGPNSPTGFDAYLWLRAHAYAGRVAFLTGHALDDPLMSQARVTGEIEVLQKPVTVDQLLALVESGDEHVRH